MSFDRKKNGWKRSPMGWQFMRDGAALFDAWHSPRTVGNARALGVDRSPWLLVNAKREELDRFPTLERLKEHVTDLLIREYKGAAS